MNLGNEQKYGHWQFDQILSHYMGTGMYVQLGEYRTLILWDKHKSLRASVNADK